MVREFRSELATESSRPGYGATATATVENQTDAFRTILHDPSQARPAAGDAGAAALSSYIGAAESGGTGAHAGVLQGPQGAAAFVAQIIHQARTSTLGAGAAQATHSATGAFVRSAQVLQAFVQRVNANDDFASAPATIAASVANVAMRNTLAVYIPTVIRQFMSYGIEAAFAKTGASDSVRTTLGLAAPVLAVGALALGGMRDRVAGTATRTSERSRIIMGATTAAAGIATAATGSMPGAAPLMLAFTAYTAMRDLVVQSRLRLNNANTAGLIPDPKHFALISLGYGIDQALVNLGMSTQASPSGAAAFSQGANVQVGNAFIRGAINTLGENGEDLMFQGIPAVREGHPLQLSIEDVGYQRNKVINGALGAWAVRTGILATTIGTLSIVADYAKNPAYANNPKLVELVSDLVVGLVNAVLYEPFANSGSAQPGASTAAHDAELGVAPGRMLTIEPAAASRSGHSSDQAHSLAVHSEGGPASASVHSDGESQSASASFATAQSRFDQAPQHPPSPGRDHEGTANT